MRKMSDNIDKLIDTLGFMKIETETGFEIYDETNHLFLGYDDDESKENVYHFLAGMRYALRKGGAVCQ